MIEFYAAVSRRSLDGFADADWHLEQRMTRDQALHALTLGAAYAAFEEGERGSIEIGKRADFTVLSADIMRIPEPEILTTRCLMTIVGGELIYGRIRPALSRITRRAISAGRTGSTSRSARRTAVRFAGRSI